MIRRRFLQISGASGLGLALEACGYRPPPPRTPWVRPANLVPVNVSWDRIIRTTVALRPYRASGFVVKAERLDDKTVIHNYGHGGAGMSLSWGTAYLSSNMAVAHSEREVAVIGCGIIGLTTARMLQRRGFRVAIYAKGLPPDTTSNKLWGGFTPDSTLVERRSSHFDGQFRRAVEIAYREHQLLVGRGYGVRWIDGYSQTDDARPGRERDPDDAVRGRGRDPLMPRGYEPAGELLGPWQHPFPSLYARRAPMLQFDPDIYLEALMRDVLAFGGSISAREFGSPRDFMSLPEPIVMNCTGLGSKRLFDDSELIPVKGQLTVLVPQPDVDYSLGGMIPRRSGIVLGHVRQRGVSSLTIDTLEQDRIMRSAIRTFSAMRPPDPRIGRARFGPPAYPPPVESFFRHES